jgi:hypothetical protein
VLVSTGFIFGRRQTGRTGGAIAASDLHLPSTRDAFFLALGDPANNITSYHRSSTLARNRVITAYPY